MAGGDERAGCADAAEPRADQPAGADTAPGRAPGRAGLSDLAASSAQFGRDRSIGGSQVFHSAERARLLRDQGLVRGIRRTVLDPYYQEVDTDPINAMLHVWQRGWLPEGCCCAATGRRPTTASRSATPCSTSPSSAPPAACGSVKVVSQGLGWSDDTAARHAGAPAHARVAPAKRSLPNPLGSWLRGGGRVFLLDTVEAVLDDPASLFVPAEVRRLSDEHLSGRADHGLKLWTLSLFAAWRKVSGAL